jgi:hypothetical protein
MSVLRLAFSVLVFFAQDPATVREWSVPDNQEVRFAARGEQGLMRTGDGGRTWQPAGQGLPKSEYGLSVSVVAFAASRRDPAVLYSSTESGSVFRSENGGATWSEASWGLPVPLQHVTRPALLSIDPSDSRVIYSLLRVPINSHLEQSQLYRSSDGGRRWELFKELPDTSTYQSLAVDSPGLLTVKTDSETFRIEDHGAVAPPIDPFTGGGVMTALPALGSTAADRDSDGVAILHDDGSLLLRTFALAQKGFQYRPAAAGSYDVSRTATNLRSTLGTQITIADEGTQSVPLPFTFTFYGRDYSSVYVNANGNVTFAAANPSGVESSASFFSGVPRIAPLWDDFNPAAAGGVFISASPGEFMVTWSQVPEFLTTNSNTFQLILSPDGNIEFQFGNVAALDGLTGVSNGGVTDGYYIAFDDNLNVTGLAAAPIHEQFATTPLNSTAIARRFFQSHEDEFDAIFVFGASELPTNLAGTGATAFYSSLRNDVRGSGLTVFDATSNVGSGGRVQGYINMNSLAYYPADITQRIGTNNDNTLTLLGQEWGHRFLAYARFRDGASASFGLLGRGNSHWNYFFNSEASMVEGNQWENTGDNTFTNRDNTQRYSVLDQYLMGFRDAVEVPPLLLITNPQPVVSGTISTLQSTFGRTNNSLRDTAHDFSRARYYNFVLGVEGTTATTTVTSSGYTQTVFDPNILNTNVDLVATMGAAANKTYTLRKNPDSSPQSRYWDSSLGAYLGDPIVVGGTPRNLTVADIIAQEGERIPTVVRSQKDFKHAFILVVPRGRQATQSDITKLLGIRQGWETFFHQATDLKGTVSTSLAPVSNNQISNSITPNGVWVYTGQSPSTATTVGPGIVDAGPYPISGVAIFAYRSGAQVVSETAVAATPALTHARFYAERSSSVDTGFAVTAVGLSSTLSLELRDSAGALMGTESLTIPPGGHSAKFISQLFPTLPASFVGSVTVLASNPVAVIALRTIVNEISEFMMTTLPVTDLDQTAPAVAQVLPHIADGGGYMVEIQLVNSGSTTLNGNVEFFSSPGGVAMSLNVDGADRSVASYSIPPNGVRVLRTSGQGVLRTGYVVVRPSLPQNGPPSNAPVASLVFTYRPQGVLVGATGVGANPLGQRLRMYFDRTTGHDTGIALVNTTSTTANLALIYRTNFGTVIPAGTLTLPAGGHTAKFVSEIGNAPPPVGIRGTLEVLSDVPLASIALRTTQSGGRFLLSTLPVVDLNRPVVGPLYFPQRAHGGGYTTEYILINAGGATVPVTLSLVVP